MKKSERQKRILREVQLRNWVPVNDLAVMLGVSADTIRRDIIALDRAGRLKRVHGGAQALGYQPYNYRVNDIYLHRQKEAIARKALPLIGPGQVILISGGTTHLELVRLLPEELQATFFTPSLPVAMQLLEHPQLEVIFAGGRLSPASQIALDATTHRQLRQVRFDLCFLGTGYLHPGAGLTESDREVAALKQTMIEVSRQVAVLTVSDKLGAVQRYRICEPVAIDLLITELEPDNDKLAAYRAAGMDIL